MKYIILGILFSVGYYLYEHYYPSSAGNWYIAANGKNCIKAGTPEFINTPTTIAERFPLCKKLETSRSDWIHFDCSAEAQLSGVNVIFADGEKSCRDYIEDYQAGRL